MGQPRPLLSFILGLFKQTLLQFFQQICVKNFHPVYCAGLEPTTFGTRVSSHNHWTRAPAPGSLFLRFFKE